MQEIINRIKERLKLQEIKVEKEDHFTGVIIFKIKDHYGKEGFLKCNRNIGMVYEKYNNTWKQIEGIKFF